MRLPPQGPSIGYGFQSRQLRNGLIAVPGPNYVTLRLNHSDAKDRLAYLDFIAIDEPAIGASRQIRLFRRLLQSALADLAAIHERAVAAAEIANADDGRIDVDHAMVPRNTHAAEFLGDNNRAIIGPADKVFAWLIEDVLLSLQSSFHDSENEMRSHEVLL
jgi:hypothetical protein